MLITRSTPQPLLINTPSGGKITEQMSCTQSLQVMWVGMLNMFWLNCTGSKDTKRDVTRQSLAACANNTRWLLGVSHNVRDLKRVKDVATDQLTRSAERVNCYSKVGLSKFERSAVGRLSNCALTVAYHHGHHAEAFRSGKHLSITSRLSGCNLIVILYFRLQAHYLKPPHRAMSSFFKRRWTVQLAPRNWSTTRAKAKYVHIYPAEVVRLSCRL